MRPPFLSIAALAGLGAHLVEVDQKAEAAPPIQDDPRAPLDLTRYLIPERTPGYYRGPDGSIRKAVHLTTRPLHKEHNKARICRRKKAR